MQQIKLDAVGVWLMFVVTLALFPAFCIGVQSTAEKPYSDFISKSAWLEFLTPAKIKHFQNTFELFSRIDAHSDKYKWLSEGGGSSSQTTCYFFASLAEARPKESRS